MQARKESELYSREDKWNAVLRLLAESGQQDSMGNYSHDSVSMLHKAAMGLLDNDYQFVFDLPKLLNGMPDALDKKNNNESKLQHLYQLGWIIWAEICNLKAALDKTGYIVPHEEVCAILESYAVRNCGKEAFPKGLLYQLSSFYLANRQNLSIASSLPVMEMSSNGTTIMMSPPVMEPPTGKPMIMLYPRQPQSPEDETLPGFKSVISDMSDRLPSLTGNSTSGLPGVNDIRNWLGVTQPLANNHFRFRFASGTNQAQAETTQETRAHEADRPRRLSN